MAKAILFKGGAWLLVIFAFYWALQHPKSAADSAGSIFGSVAAVGTSALEKLAGVVDSLPTGEAGTAGTTTPQQSSTTGSAVQPQKRAKQPAGGS